MNKNHIRPGQGAFVPCHFVGLKLDSKQHFTLQMLKGSWRQSIHGIDIYYHVHEIFMDQKFK